MYVILVVLWVVVRRWVSGKLLTGGQSDVECGGESSSFLVISNFASLGEDVSVLALIAGGS